MPLDPAWLAVLRSRGVIAKDVRVNLAALHGVAKCGIDAAALTQAPMPKPAKSKRIKHPTESALVKAILDYLRLRGIMAWRVQNQGTYDPTRGVRRKFHGLKGVSDIAGVLAGGRALHIEVKLPGGKLSDEQKRFIDGVNQRGGVAFVARSLRDVEMLLNGLE